MADRFRSLAKVIAGEKHRLFNNTKTVVNNITESAHERLNNVQNVVATKYDTISKQINNDITVFQNLSAVQLESKSEVPERIAKWWHWYQHLTGLDTVELSKKQVIRAQDKLFKCQDERRPLNREVTMLNDKLKDIYAELVQTKRGDPRYVQLTIIENKILQDQTRIIGQLELLEKEEREHFTLLATAIKEYHDSQTINAQKYKYLSIIASAVIAIVSLTGSMIYNNKRIRDVRKVIAEAQVRNESSLLTSFTTLENNVNEQLSQIINKLSANTPNGINVPPKGISAGVDNFTVLVLGITGIYIIKKIFFE